MPHASPCALPQSSPTAHNPNCRDCVDRWNSVIVATLAYHDERFRLAQALYAASAHGVTLAELVNASHLEQAEIERLIEEASL